MIFSPVRHSYPFSPFYPFFFPLMFQLTAPICTNACLHGAYHRLTIDLGELAKTAHPGQFVQVQIPNLEGHVLRRPFSICDVDGTILTLVYKVVGTGTEALANAMSGTPLNILGPLGHGFTALPKTTSTFPR